MAEDEPLTPVRIAARHFYEQRIRFPGPIESMGTGVVEGPDGVDVPGIFVYWNDRAAMKRIAPSLQSWEGFPMTHRYSGKMRLCGAKATQG